MTTASKKSTDQPPISTALAGFSEITVDDDPKTLKEAMEQQDWPEWQKAIDDVLVLMAKYHVWDIVDEPADKNIVDVVGYSGSNTMWPKASHRSTALTSLTPLRPLHVSRPSELLSH